MSSEGEKMFKKITNKMSRGGYKGMIQRPDGRWTVDPSTPEGQILLTIYEVDIESRPPGEREEYRRFLVEQGIIPDRKKKPGL